MVKTICVLCFNRHRVIDTRARFFLLYDPRLFQKDYYYLWKKIVNVIFIRKFFEVNRYELMTVPFPSPIEHSWKPLRIDSWRSGKYQVTCSQYCSNLIYIFQNLIIGNICL